MIIDQSTRIYIAGAGGMLGGDVYRHFSPIAQVKATDIDASDAWLERVDVCDHTETRRSIQAFVPHIIINLAALTDLERCEREPAEARLVNTAAADHLAATAASLGAVYVFVSTGCVFDGTKQVYTEADKPNPLNVYGRSKLDAERATQRRTPKHYILRAGWMMGGGPSKDKKFLNNIYKLICAGARELSIVDSTWGSPTYTVDFADGLHRVLESGAYGLYHQAGSDHCNRFEMAQEFVRLLNLSDRVAVNRAEDIVHAQRYTAPRPISEALVNARLISQGMNVMRPWRAALADYAVVFASDLEDRRAWSSVSR